MLAENKRAENSHIWERHENDWYVEPSWCSERLFEVEEFEGGVHDPACGCGTIPKAAIKAGYTASGTDIVDRGFGQFWESIDFLKAEYEWDNFVTNPPFDRFEPFARKALSLARRKVAMIWMVRRLNAARWLQETPLKTIYLLTPRPSMPPGEAMLRGDKIGGGKQDFCWLVWERGHLGKPTIEWLHRDRGRK